MYQATKTSPGRQRLYIVIVSDVDVLHKFTSKFQHKILAEVVTVCPTTSEEDPLDLTYQNTNTDFNINPCYHNLLEMSAIFAENYKKDESTLSESVVETAKAKFKQHKAIIIKGPRKCGKTTLAALLTSIYQPGEFLIIYKADDTKYISLDKVCLVVVEDFAGKYRYDNVGASDWMRAFDMLHSLVKAGKLNVVLTCKDTFLAECKKDFEDHPIFDNPVQMEESDIRIKQEEDENVTGNLMPFNYNERGWFC
ncbi:uncharacterized protein LOC132730637 [Ruditapes philippinarum]|uniref:uncharacterized protein LOC132730637 n=1 Tax=Ruditapes philippinarum TaxID=129788 RepID=UPI00295B12F2|nr:uncharacterized protein LOC132730637 [Ruditapes philippinarum]